MEKNADKKKAWFGKIRNKGEGQNKEASNGCSDQEMTIATNTMANFNELILIAGDELTVQGNSDFWIVDLGTTVHMTNDTCRMTDYIETEKLVSVKDGNT